VYAAGWLLNNREMLAEIYAKAWIPRWVYWAAEQQQGNASGKMFISRETLASIFATTGKCRKKAMQYASREVLRGSYTKIWRY